MSSIKIRCSNKIFFWQTSVRCKVCFLFFFGKGAAALMILGGIKELYTDIISTKALELLQKSDIKVGFTEKVPFIWNRNHTGGCPVETMCSEVESAEEILPLIRDFLEKIRNKK